MLIAYIRAILAFTSLPAMAVVLALFLMTNHASAEASIVKIDNFTFNPPELTIKLGTTVTWENGDDIPHLVVDSSGKFRSKALDTGEKFTMAFTNAGEITYFCGLHPHMTGKIIVKP
jgi:plastocyanin